MKVFKIIVVVWLLIGAYSCNKDSNILVFEGTVSLQNTSQKVDGTMVLLKGKIVSDNSYGREMELAKESVKSDGTYHIEIDNVRASEFTITIQKDNFFSISKKISGSATAPGTPYRYNVVLYPKAYLKLRLRNYYEPRKQEDAVTLSINHTSPSCEVCCSVENEVIKGADVDTTFQCLLYGNQTVHVKWIVNKDGEITNHNEDLYCKENDTTTYTIDY